jgi:hypothetical protein
MDDPVELPDTEKESGVRQGERNANNVDTETRAGSLQPRWHDLALHSQRIAAPPLQPRLEEE